MIRRPGESFHPIKSSLSLSLFFWSIDQLIQCITVLLLLTGGVRTVGINWGNFGLVSTQASKNISLSLIFVFNQLLYGGGQQASMSIDYEKAWWVLQPSQDLYLPILLALIDRLIQCWTYHFYLLEVSSNVGINHWKGGLVSPQAFQILHPSLFFGFNQFLGGGGQEDLKLIDDEKALWVLQPSQAPYISVFLPWSINWYSAWM